MNHEDQAQTTAAIDATENEDMRELTLEESEEVAGGMAAAHKAH